MTDYLHDTRAYDLVKPVHVEAGWSGPDPVGETTWLQSIADVHGFPHGFVAYAALNTSDVDRVLNRHRDPAKTYLSRPDRPCLDVRDHENSLARSVEPRSHSTWSVVFDDGCSRAGERYREATE